MYQVTNSNATQFDHMASFSLYSAGAPASAVVIRPEERLSINAAPREISQRFEVFNWQAAVRLLGQKLSYVGHHSNSTYKSFDPSAGDQVNFFKGQSIGQSTLTKSTQESHEIRLQNEERIGGMVDYVVGYFHNTLNPPSQLDRVTPVGLNFGSFGALATTAVTKIGRSGSSNEESYFGNLTVHLGEATELSGGVRHIKYASTAALFVGSACANTTYFESCARLTAADENSRSSHTIYSASAKHRFNESLMVYASFGTSWRPPISVVGDFSVKRSALENSFLILPAETSKSYEIGFKSDWFDKRLQLNVTAYQQDFVNFPYRSTSGVYFLNCQAADSAGNCLSNIPTNFNFVGAVPVRVRGLEVEGSFKITPNWTIGGNVNYSLGRLKNGTMPCNDLNKDGVPDVLTSAPSVAQLQAAYGANNLGSCNLNVRSGSAPVWSGVVNTEYNASLSDKLDGFLRGVWSWRGKTGNDPQNSFDDIGRNSTLNLFLGLRDPDGAWEVSLFGKNVLNDRTVTSVSNGPLSTSYQSLPYAMVNGVPQILGRPSGAVFTSTYAGITMAPPREFGVSVRIALGSR
jgi:iron complex outermembrane receptor protein